MSEWGSGDAHAQIERLEAQLRKERAEWQAKAERAAGEHARMQERLDDLEGKLAALLDYLPEQDVIEAVHRRGGQDALRETEGRPPPQHARGHLRRVLAAIGLAGGLAGLCRALGAHGRAVTLSAMTAGLSAAAAATYVLAPDVTRSLPAPLPVSSPAAGVPSVPLPAAPGVPSLPPASLARPRPAASPAARARAIPVPSAGRAASPAPSADARISGGLATPPAVVTIPPAVLRRGGKLAGGAGPKVPHPRLPSPPAVPSPVLPSFTPPAVPSPAWLPSELRCLKAPGAVIVL
jgi:hypothetical protein